uniref:Reverse transcriptase domain-containing protein n=1 Tax=Tanacetum cinerariifolium TaxID=118510 RepID=A0A6L2NJI7_TANCI|nr:reverse transcriptase domain-containing protein [Tanacetum cinerariifolium]
MSHVKVKELWKIIDNEKQRCALDDEDADSIPNLVLVPTSEELKVEWREFEVVDFVHAEEEVFPQLEMYRLMWLKTRWSIGATGKSTTLLNRCSIQAEVVNYEMNLVDCPVVKKDVGVVQNEVVNCETNLVDYPLVEKDVGVVHDEVSNCEMNLVDWPVVEKDVSDPKNLSYRDTQPSPMDHLINACAYVNNDLDDYIDIENDPLKYCLDNMTIDIEEDTRSGKLIVSLYEEPKKDPAKYLQHNEKIDFMLEDKEIVNENNDFDKLLKLQMIKASKVNVVKGDGKPILDKVFEGIGRIKKLDPEGSREKLRRVEGLVEELGGVEGPGEELRRSLRFGTPRAIISDRGMHFCNDQFVKVMVKFGVTHRLATPHHPQTSGQVEVSNCSLKYILERIVGENHASRSNKLDDALWAFRTAYKTPIGCTPYKLVYGKACHLLIELEQKAYWALKHANFDLQTAGDHKKVQLNELRDQAYENSLIYKEKTKRLHNSKIKDCVFNIEDRVLLYNSQLKIFSSKLKSRWSGPFTISHVYPYGTVELSQPDRPNFKVNGHRLKHYFGKNIPKLVDPDLQTFPKDH